MAVNAPKRHDSLPNLMHLAHRMYRKGGRKESTAQTENRVFREYFGVAPLVAVTVWELLMQNDLVPEGGDQVHLLWTLSFLKIYGKTQEISDLACTDPKTFRK